MVDSSMESDTASGKGIDASLLHQTNYPKFPYLICKGTDSKIRL